MFLLSSAPLRQAPGGLVPGLPRSGLNSGALRALAPAPRSGPGGFEGPLLLGPQRPRLLWHRSEDGPHLLPEFLFRHPKVLLAGLRGPLSSRASSPGGARLRVAPALACSSWARRQKTCFHRPRPRPRARGSGLGARGSSQAARSGPPRISLTQSQHQPAGPSAGQSPPRAEGARPQPSAMTDGRLMRSARPGVQGPRPR